eukprot:16887-Alexandrium_andersonii.AAC.1
MRELLGQELLAIQGFALAAQQPGNPPYTQRELVEMAGNAFSGFVGGAVLLSLLTSAELRFRFSLPTPCGEATAPSIGIETPGLES